LIDGWYLLFSSGVLIFLSIPDRRPCTLPPLRFRENPFHSFDHAAHVTMSVSKLLARIVAPETVDPTVRDGKTFESLRHDHTYGKQVFRSIAYATAPLPFLTICVLFPLVYLGITSDPLTQVGTAHSALL